MILSALVGGSVLLGQIGTAKSIDNLELEIAIHEPDAMANIGTVVQVHGITADLDEGGMFARLADRLAVTGFTVVRFSFRGHGRSEGTQRGMTFAGEMLDLQAILSLAEGYGKPVSVVAASFGAAVTAQSLPFIDAELKSLALWNPVLDTRKTFVEPELPWGLENFGPAQQARLKSQGYLLIDDNFEMGRVLHDEMSHYHPLDNFLASSVPAMIVHGEKDTAVSYEIARNAAAQRAACDFVTIEGSDHGFDTTELENEAIDHTVSWLRAQYGVR